MFKLFTLSSFLFIIASFPFILKGAEGAVGLSFLVTNQKGAVDVFRLNNDDEAESVLSRLNVQLPTLKNYWTLSMSFDVAKKDYSSFLLRDENGEETPLSDRFDKKETTGNLALSYQKGSHSVSALIARSLNESPFFQTGAFLSYNKTFLNKKKNSRRKGGL